MSRWAELFDALSGDDDKRDKRRQTEGDLPDCHRLSCLSKEENAPPVALDPVAEARAEVDVDDLEERGADVEYDGNIPRSWAEGYAALSTMPTPAGFMPDRWRRIVDAAGFFIDRWAVHAAECGWTALDVFGCHNTRPDARFDCWGLLLLLDRNKVAAIDEKGADLLTANGTHLRFYRRPIPAGTVTLWDLVRADSVA